MTIAAKYENGVFRPLEGVVIAEGTVVEIEVPAAHPGHRRSNGELGFACVRADRGDIGDRAQGDKRRPIPGLGEFDSGRADVSERARDFLWRGPTR